MGKEARNAKHKFLIGQQCLQEVDFYKWISDKQGQVLFWYHI